MRGPVRIDGSMGEGGGQILRTALAVAAVLGTPVEVFNIRAKRKRPGLRPQHLTAVKAIAALTSGRVRGAYVGSTTLYFEPHRIKGGSYEFDVGTAGSVSLVLQGLRPVMAFADGPVTVRLRGGTDVPMAPTIDYVRNVLLWHLSQLGYDVEVTLHRRGHYPRGGGLVEVKVGDPPGGFRARDYLERGRLREVRGISHAVRLPRHVAERQAKAAGAMVEEKLGIKPEIEVEWYEPQRDPHLGPGSGVALWASYEQTVMGADSLGAKGKRAELVGREAASKLIEDTATGAALDRHMSDMIIVYLALSDRPSRIWGARLTLHALTVLQLLDIMIPGYTYIIEEGSEGRPFRALIRPRAIPP